MNSPHGRSECVYEKKTFFYNRTNDNSLETTEECSKSDTLYLSWRLYARPTTTIDIVYVTWSVLTGLCCSAEGLRPFEWYRPVSDCVTLGIVGIKNCRFQQLSRRDASRLTNKSHSQEARNAFDDRWTVDNRRYRQASVAGRYSRTTDRLLRTAVLLAAASHAIIYEVRPRSHEICFLAAPPQVAWHVRTGWIRRGGLSPSRCTGRQSVPSIGCVRIADLVRPRFETASRRTMEDALEQRWPIKCRTKLKTEKLPQLTNRSNRRTGSLVYRVCKLRGGWKNLRNASKGWTMDGPRSGRPNRWKRDSCARFVGFWSSDGCSVVGRHSGHSENRCASHRYGWIKRAKDIIAATRTLRHDNAASHESLRGPWALSEAQRQSPYSPDLAPAADFLLFPRINTALKGHHFDNTEAIQAAVTTALSEVPVEVFSRGRTGHGRVGGNNVQDSTSKIPNTLYRCC